MDGQLLVAQFGSTTEIAAVEGAGQILRRVSVRTDLYTERELQEMQAWLDRVNQPIDPLRLVR